MSDNNETEKVPVDDQRLERAQVLRHDLVAVLLYNEDGTIKTDIDLEKVNVCKGLMKDSDSSIYTKRRVMTEEKSVEVDRQAAEILRRMDFAPPKRKDEKMQLTKDYKGPEIDESLLPDDEMPEGITKSLGGETIDMDEIMSRGRSIRLQEDEG